MLNRRESWPGYSTYSIWQTLLGTTRKLGKDHGILGDLYNTQMTIRLTELSEDIQRVYKKVRNLRFIYQNQKWFKLFFDSFVFILFFCYKICLLMFECLKGLVPAYLSDLCVGTAAVPGRSGLRSAARGDLVVPGHRTEWGSRSFAVPGSKCWNKLRLDLEICWLVLRLLFARHLKTNLFTAGFSD